MSIDCCHPPRAIYVHVPFCFSLCPFCDFFKVVERRSEEFRLFSLRLTRQIQQLARDIDLRRVDTVFIGGGTPTGLGRKRLSSLVRTLRRCCPGVTEFTVESNPELLSRTLLEQLSDAGVTRLSVGLQCHNDTLLRRLGRRNRVADNLRALELLQRYWDTPFSLDFIYGVEGQSPGDVRADLALIRDVCPPHLSWYQLTVEEGTPLHGYVRERRVLLPDEDELAGMERELAEGLPEVGLTRYEISNYCRPEMECRHNQHYWRLDSYAGVGPAAVGTLPALTDRASSWRMQGSNSLSAYMSDEDFALRWQWIDGRETAFEVVMMGLRTTLGIQQSSFHSRFGVALADLFPHAFGRGRDAGWLVRQEGYVRATSLGLRFLDMLTSWFWEDVRT